MRGMQTLRLPTGHSCVLACARWQARRVGQQVLCNMNSARAKQPAHVAPPPTELGELMAIGHVDQPRRHALLRVWASVLGGFEVRAEDQRTCACCCCPRLARPASLRTWSKIMNTSSAASSSTPPFPLPPPSSILLSRYPHLHG